MAGKSVPDAGPCGLSSGGDVTMTHDPGLALIIAQPWKWAISCNGPSGQGVSDSHGTKSGADDVIA